MLFKKNKISKRSLTTTDEELAKLLGIDINGISSNKAREATFYTCLRILSDTVSKLPLKLYKESTNGTDVASKHYLHNKMKLRPNKNMSSSDFWKMIEFQRSYFGHSVVAVHTAPNGKVEGLHPLDMANVEIWVDNNAIIGKDSAIWYVYKQGTREFKFRSEEVLHFKGLTRDGIHGMPIKDYLATVVENLQYSSDYVNKYFKGGLTAKGLLQYTGDIEPEAINRVKARFEKMANGMDNVGKILPVPPGYEFQTINTSMADAQFFEITNLSIRQIASAFGIKQHMINDLSGAKFNNVTQQNEEFYRDTLQSILTMYEQELTYKLLTEKEINEGKFFRFNVDAILRTDLKTRYEAYKIGIEGGFLMPNEARKKEDMVSAEGADQLIVNGTMQPLDKVGMAYEGQGKNAFEGGENIDDEQGNTNTNDAD
ncbi:phage portal protein [Halobacillus sp. A5]|uniref:phage portal protein n=1 Tax=Halobacillus sp. A5 TaxID=2880263 RepID=UPI0020A6379A|nr:phage portal protein [Halobacillus sp. A5]MCP3026003.1 phage portal protein [Halobacillus sp. A5]